MPSDDLTRSLRSELLGMPKRLHRLALGCAAAALLALPAVEVAAQVAGVTGFRLAVAEASALDEELAAFSRGRNFEGVWTGSDPAVVERRNALLGALADAAAHGLPRDRFDPMAVIAALHAAETVLDQGEMEVALSRLYLDYARSIQSGLLTPREVVGQIVREVTYTPRQQLLEEFIAAPEPASYLRGLAPQSPEYVRLMREKLRLEMLLQTGGWGPAVPAGRIEPGASGEAVVALRNRLIAMGYLQPTVTGTYDTAMMEAVQKFQDSVGLAADGVAGASTIAALNTPVEERLQAILVAMERERWMNFERGDRHIWVNLTDFSATIVDHDRVTFRTRSVIGAMATDRQTPEFSDVMEYMVINPSWWVPRSIIMSEYLPALRRNPGAVGHLQIINSRGQVVNRSSANFSGGFNYSMRQPPGPGNALGVVKFMFPNPYNIYLHDTPSRGLFNETVRTFSHGCVRLNDPRDFAFALLAAQTDDPVEFFNVRLRSGAETRVDLEVPVPVHLVYRTAFTSVTGEMQYRNDVYGRDARIWDALERAGVEIGAVRG